MQKKRKTSKVQKLQPKCLHMVKSQTQILSKEKIKKIRGNKKKKKKKKTEFSKRQNLKKCKMSMGENDIYKNKLVKIFKAKTKF